MRVVILKQDVLGDDQNLPEHSPDQPDADNTLL